MSDFLFTKEQWEKLFDGWNVAGISVRAKDSFYFLLREAQHDGGLTKPDIEYKSR